ncbi:hypothetical protein NL676_032558 [Syzygium grande]|nr:hypothetical protein NL676_032558 [Syzygium grande]
MLGAQSENPRSNPVPKRPNPNCPAAEPRSPAGGERRHKLDLRVSTVEPFFGVSLSREPPHRTRASNHYTRLRDSWTDSAVPHVDRE